MACAPIPAKPPLKALPSTKIAGSDQDSLTPTYINTPCLSLNLKQCLHHFFYMISTSGCCGMKHLAFFDALLRMSENDGAGLLLSGSPDPRLELDSGSAFGHWWASRVNPMCSKTLTSFSCCWCDGQESIWISLCRGAVPPWSENWKTWSRRSQETKQTERCSSILVSLWIHAIFLWHHIDITWSRCWLLTLRSVILPGTSKVAPRVASITLSHSKASEITRWIKFHGVDIATEVFLCFLLWVSEVHQLWWVSPWKIGENDDSASKFIESPITKATSKLRSCRGGTCFGLGITKTFLISTSSGMGRPRSRLPGRRADVICAVSISFPWKETCEIAAAFDLNG